MKTQNKVIILCVLMVILPGCATLLKGNEDTVLLFHGSDSLRINTIEGEDVPIKTYTVDTHYSKVHRKEILLWSKENHTLVLREGERQKVIVLRPRIVPGWVMLDIVFGIVPLFVDAYTGSWNAFEHIDASWSANQ